MSPRFDEGAFLQGPSVAGTEEMRAATRAFEWSRTPLGPVAGWSNSLRNIVNLVLNSRHPMFLWWGAELTQFYNDAYRRSLGADRHPAALGAAGREFWAEIWPIIGPQIDAVMQRGESTWNEDHLVPILRNGRLEEVYWTYGYSPVWDDDGRIAGTLVVVQEQTARVLAARRVRTVRDLASAAGVHRTRTQAWHGSLEVLSANPHDVPWVLALATAISDEGRAPTLVGQRPLRGLDGALLLQHIEAVAGEALQRVLETGTPHTIDDLRPPTPEAVVPPWPEPAIAARLVPIRSSRSTVPNGILVLGLSPRLPFDEAYDEFLSMAAEQVSVGLANAQAHEDEQRLAEAQAQLSARFRDLLQQAPTGVAAFSGPLHRFELANPIYLAMTQRAGVIGRTLLDVFPELAGTDLMAVFDRVYATGEAFAADEYRVELDRQGQGVLEESFFGFRLAASRDDRGAISGLIAVVADVTEQVRTRRALQRAQARLDFTLAAAGVGYWDLDLDTHQANCSVRHQQIFGYAAISPGWTLALFLEHVIPEERDRVAAAVQRCADAGDDLEVECQIETITGARRWIHCHARVERAGSVRRLLGIVQDVTERRDLLAREQRARQASEQASHAKDQFLATLGHELRTPMNTIVGWTDLLAEGGLGDDDVRDGIATIQRHAQAQARMIEDLLDMGRIVSGQVRITPRLVPLAHVVRAAIAAIEPAARARTITLVEVLMDDGELVAADPVLLQQVFWNLLGNAVKFTPPGGVISVVGTRTGGSLEVAVRDTGQGIDTEFLPHMFDRFRQGNASATREHGGLGIGLSIVKQLVEAHGGTVRGSSNGRGRGSTFTVSLPQAPGSTASVQRLPPAPDSELVSPAPAMRDLGGTRILVVDDDRDTRELIARILVGCHASVVTAESAAEALGAIHLHPFDLLISDIGMPHEDGYELIQKVRQLAPAAAAALPALALTAYGRPEDRRRALLSGFQDHMSKPIQLARFLQTCAALIEGGAVR